MTSQANVIPAESVSARAGAELVISAMSEADRLGKQVVVAVCDGAGVLKAFTRMDGAPMLSVEIAQNKAYTAAAHGVATGDWYDLIKDDPGLLHGLVQTPRFVIFAGGFPVTVDGQLVGGMGVSGAAPDEDAACVRFALSVNGFDVEGVKMAAGPVPPLQ